VVRIDVAEAVGGWFQRHPNGCTGMLVGVSGGADSVGLLRAIDACRRSLALEVRVAHLDHALRADSAAAAAWVAGLSGQLGLPVTTQRTDIRRRAAETGRGIEETARAARYEFLECAAMTHRCSHIAVAHTADDQAETILHHVLRGTGLAGLRGMPELRPLSPEVTLVRPLLGVARADVLRYLAELGQEYLIDATNDDERLTRNRLRQTLLPLLRMQFNPQVTDSLTRLGKQVADVQGIIERLARQLLESSVIERTHERVVLDCVPLRDADCHLLREALRLLWAKQQWPRRRMGFDHWDRLARLAQTGPSSQSLTLPEGMTARRIRSTIELVHAQR
jgi:tRNA(Ile)-lysidine synthase